jgi:hypothetical protein
MIANRRHVNFLVNHGVTGHKMFFLVSKYGM